MKKILIIEDDKWISASLKLYLENSWYKVSLHHEWLEAEKKLQLLSPDLVILDINLPGKDGIEITKDVRRFSEVPIIMLTARWRELDRVKWLEVWADDYIAKPFSPRELLARIHTIMRRFGDTSNVQEKQESTLECGNVTMNPNKKSVSVDGKNISLTGNEFDILKKLMEQKWWIVTRDTIMKEIIWYDKYIYDRTIDTHIKNLRRKLWMKDYILTIRWEWYRINI